MRELVIKTFCDVCFDEEEMRRETDISALLQIRSFKRSLDLCENHEKDILGPLRDILEQFGRRKNAVSQKPPAKATQLKLEVPKSEDGKWACPLPNCDSQLSPKSAVWHLTNVHHIEDKGLLVCPDCSKSFATPGGCRIHRTASHGYNQIDELLNKALGVAA